MWMWRFAGYHKNGGWVRLLFGVATVFGFCFDVV